MSLQNVIIDTDVGCDDAITIALALNNPRLTVHAVTTVFGNVSVAQATENVRVLLKYFNHADIPIYRGLDTDYSGVVPVIDTWPGHGANGLGDHAFFPSCPPGFLPEAQSETAPQALVRLARARPGFYDILALGPLSNVAEAIRIDPQFPSLVRSLAWMGGSAIARGNVTETAEFNAHADAPAAAACLGAFPPRAVTVVPWEATVASEIPWSALQRLAFDQPFPPEYSGPAPGAITALAAADAKQEQQQQQQQQGASSDTANSEYKSESCGMGAQAKFRFFLSRVTGAYWVFTADSTRTQARVAAAAAGAGPLSSYLGAARDRLARTGRCCPLMPDAKTSSSSHSSNSKCTTAKGANSADEAEVCEMCRLEGTSHAASRRGLIICDAAAYMAMAEPTVAVTGVSVAAAACVPEGPAKGTLVVDWYGRGETQSIVDAITHAEHHSAQQQGSTATATAAASASASARVAGPVVSVAVAPVVRFVRGVRGQALCDAMADLAGAERFDISTLE